LIVELNPIIAMGDFRHHIMANLDFLRLKELTYGLISWGKCSFERLTLVKSEE
jgi:hypothetical protein